MKKFGIEMGVVVVEAVPAIPGTVICIPGNNRAPEIVHDRVEILHTKTRLPPKFPEIECRARLRPSLDGAVIPGYRVRVYALDDVGHLAVPARQHFILAELMIHPVTEFSKIRRLGLGGLQRVRAPDRLELGEGGAGGAPGLVQRLDVAVVPLSPIRQNGAIRLGPPHVLAGRYVGLVITKRIRERSERPEGLSLPCQCGFQGILVVAARDGGPAHAILAHLGRG